MEKNTIEKSELHSQMNAMNSNDMSFKDALDMRAQYTNVREVVDQDNEVSIWLVINITILIILGCRIWTYFEIGSTPP